MNINHGLEPICIEGAVCVCVCVCVCDRMIAAAAAADTFDHSQQNSITAHVQPLEVAFLHALTF